MIKYTKHTLKKIEDLFDKIKYKNRRIAVINKFYDAEARINCLIEILGNVEVDIETLDDKEKKLYDQLTQVFKAKEESLEEEQTKEENFNRH